MPTPSPTRARFAASATAGRACGPELTRAADTACVIDPVERDCRDSEEGVACPEGTECA